MTSERQETGKQTVILGAEYDDALRAALKRALIRLGARQLSHDFGVAGSQELETVEIDVAGESLSVEAETFVGIVISGEGSLVMRVEQLVKEELKSPTENNLDRK